MRKHFISILLTVLMVLLAGCSKPIEEPQTLQIVSSESDISEPKQSENDIDEPEDFIESENLASSTEQEIVKEQTETVDSKEEKSTSSSESKPTEENNVVSEPNKEKTAESKPTETQSPESSKPTENKPAEESEEPESRADPVIQVADPSEVEAKVAVYINQYRSSNATVLNGLTSVARYRSRQLVTDFSHSDGIDACNALQYGEFVDMTLYGMLESDSYYQGYNREAIAKGDWSGTADEIAQKIANGFKNSSSHWSYLGSSEYSYIAVGCTYDSSTSIWYCCICVSSKNYGG